MDLIKFLTFVVQAIHEERQPWRDKLEQNPGSDACEINNASGYIRGLTKTEQLIRKMVEDFENGNLRPPEVITISPIGNQFRASDYDLNFRR